MKAPIKLILLGMLLTLVGVFVFLQSEQHTVAYALMLLGNALTLGSAGTALFRYLKHS
jgi:hypothetical protein